jgi:hypothetical protein
MAQKTTSPEGSAVLAGAGAFNGTQTRPPEVVDLLDKVAGFLGEGHPNKALGMLARSKVDSPWLKNALGVCQLRLGNAEAAVNVFRGLVLAAGGLVLRPDVPTVFKTNYAAALLAADNLSGCRRVLDEVRHEPHPAVRRLREATRRWLGGLTIWQKVSWYLGGQPARPLVLDFPAGDLE